MTDRWHHYFLELINGRHNGVFANCLRALLLAFSWIYGGIIAIRNLAYDHHLLRRNRPAVPLIISIGNITAGGTGKTPAVLMLSQALSKSTPLAILSRGYKSPAETKKHPLILCQGSGPLFSAAQCGDEPYLLAQNLPEAIVIVGKNRSASAQMAYSLGAKIVVLDDGMQHRRLDRDLEIVMIDARNPFGNGYLLPRGLMREHAYALKRADLLILNHVEEDNHYSHVQQQLKHYSDAPTVGVRLELQHIYNDQRQPILSLSKKRVGIFCGIANPERFQQTVSQQGAQVIKHHFLPDHAPFDRNALMQFAKECQAQGAEFLVCTEKDFVKLDLPNNLPIPVAWLQMHLRVVNDASHWRAFIEKAERICGKKSVT